MQTEKKPIQISVIIITKNRPSKLLCCLRSIADNTFRNYQIIVVDQSTNSQQLSNKDIRKLYPQVTIFQSSKTGKSKGLNQALLHAQGEILSFTDDDCIVSKSWLSTVDDSFRMHPNTAAFFGKTLSYTATKKPHTVCPSTFTRSRYRTINKLGYHVSEIGFGNNMSIRKSACLAVKGFRPWLGPGAIGPTAEDAEIAIRLLTHHYTLAYDPRIVSYHDRWLNARELRKQEVSYGKGEAACYAYYYFQSYQFAKPILKKGLLHYLKLLQKHSISILRFCWNRQTVGSFYWALTGLISYAAGICIGFYFSNLDPLPDNTA